MKNHVLLALASVFSLVACDPDHTTSVDSGSGAARLSLVAAPLAAPVAARAVGAARAEVGGKIILALSNPALLVNRSDTVTWDGSDTLRTNFESLLPGAGYRLCAQYLDAKGIVTHRDSTAAFALGRAQDLALTLQLKAVLGKILLQFPTIPDGIDSLSLAVTAGGSSWSTRIARPSAGRGSLRLDSLPLGAALSARLRAWTAAGDTLYFLDTSLSLSSDEDQVLAWTLGSALGRTQSRLTFLAGGEASGLVGFAGSASLPSSQDGTLLFTGFSDSGQADWVRITNPGTRSFSGEVKLARGTLDTVLKLDLPAGESRIVTRATPEMLALAGHPLQGKGAITASIATVTWSATGGTVWALSSKDGAILHDMVYVLPGKNGWSALNTSTHRTALLRTKGSAVANDAGSAWCGLGVDDPAGACL